MDSAFAVWITGLPASGKSTIAAALRKELAAAGVDAAIIDSDQMRRILTPHSRYDDRERQAFYGTLARLAARLVSHGVPVIVAATAHRRAWRDAARLRIPRFCEVLVECPLAVCTARDPKGIYRRGALGRAGPVPGLQVPYERPFSPELVIRGDRETPAAAAHRIALELARRGFVSLQPEN